MGTDNQQTKTYSLTLPYPPSTNNLYENTTRGRRKSECAKQYRIDVQKILLVEKVRPLLGPVCLTLHVFRPRKARDLSNCVKALEDALTGFAYQDDKQVVEIYLRRDDDKVNPRVEVTVKPFDPKNVPYHTAP